MPAPLHVEGKTADDFYYTDFACEACILEHRGERKTFGVDYGFDTDNISPASVLGSIKSEKKATAARINASKPRTRKFWKIKNKVGAFNRSVIAISKSPEGEKKAREAGYERVSLREMTDVEKKCLRDYDRNNPTAFPAQYLG